MPSPYTDIAILGPGLLGGSIGLAAQRQGISAVFWGRSEGKLAPVREAGFRASTDLASVIQGAQLIIMALPVPYMEAMAHQLISAGLTPEQLVTDVGSVKGTVVQAMRPALQDAGFQFIGSHPMAGSEQQGFTAAREDLLLDAMCILTPQQAQPASLAALHAFWLQLGMRTTELAPAAHDEVISRVSHVPHILSAVCAHVALPVAENGACSGGGLRDTSRVAAGDADLWQGILAENATAISAHLQDAISRLQQYQAAISQSDHLELKALLREDKSRRDSYFAPTQEA